jgi:E3 ubiquitin-protein ligase DOA10
MAEPEHKTDQEPVPEQEKQCRICFEGEDESLGRLIRPCLCRGSISVSQLLPLECFKSRYTDIVERVSSMSI